MLDLIEQYDAKPVAILTGLTGILAVQKTF